MFGDFIQSDQWCIANRFQYIIFNIHILILDAQSYENEPECVELCAS
jgi:hypothetical protein